MIKELFWYSIFEEKVLSKDFETNLLFYGHGVYNDATQIYFDTREKAVEYGQRMVDMNIGFKKHDIVEMKNKISELDHEIVRLLNLKKFMK